MTDKPVKCELIDWDQVVSLSRKLFLSIRESGFEPDLVVTIARGGYVPARLLCDHLDIYDLTSMRISHYTEGAGKLEQARLSMPLSVDVTGKNVLLVDDVADSGDTFALALQHIRQHKPRMLKSAVLHYKIESTLVPDYFAEKLLDWHWLIYPWALMEDLSGFIKQLDTNSRDPDTLCQLLKQKHNIEVSSGIVSMLLLDTSYFS